ncbi:MAG: FAD binding domain-containing protein [Arenicellales bacterium]|jgi:carbon-monoxide dehydrogenase medium subunit|nr:FAD binding domain-containing protein [Arenicellales bacterium]MDP6853969.1 FAD binding domain-containing protein [Arenicellales bacterium]MDP6947807.1 FAD binding domain-containing protein [Arenicellales bacterium]
MTACLYTRLDTVDDAVQCLASAGEDGHVIAGGVALGILLNERLVKPTHLLDISRIKALKRIEVTAEGVLSIGALATHQEVLTSAVVAATCPLLIKMSSEIACERIRNRGTIGGSICLGDPQADPPVALLALDAVVRAAGPQGLRDIPIRTFFQDVYTTALQSDEILQEIRIPRIPDGGGMAYQKFSARRAMDYATTVSAAVQLACDPDDGRIINAGLGLGGVGVTPVWSKAIADGLLNATPCPEIFAWMRKLVHEELSPIGDHLYSADYKSHVAAVILRRATERAYNRAVAGSDRR